MKKADDPIDVLLLLAVAWAFASAVLAWWFDHPWPKGDAFFTYLPLLLNGAFGLSVSLVTSYKVVNRMMTISRSILYGVTYAGIGVIWQSVFSVIPSPGAPHMMSIPWLASGFVVFCTIAFSIFDARKRNAAANQPEQEQQPKSQ